MFDSAWAAFTVFREVQGGAAGRRACATWPMTRLPYGAHGEGRAGGPRGPTHGRPDRSVSACLVVIACNTASTLVLPHLRERYGGSLRRHVPAIKPACAASHTKRVSVLGTKEPSRANTLARSFAISAMAQTSRWLAQPSCSDCEAELRGDATSDVSISEEIAPCFVDEDGRRTDNHRAGLHALPVAAVTP